MNSFVQDKGVEKKSDDLTGRKIAMGVCGSIGAVEVVKIIRELRRHGADVQVFVTPSVSLFITDLSLEWASNRSVISQMDAQVEHLEAYDLVLILPATLNTLSKSAVGIADNAVTLLVASQLGRKARCLFVPAMNEALQSHPAYRDHVAKLESWGARVWESENEESRLKTPSPERVADFVIRWEKSL